MYHEWRCQGDLARIFERYISESGLNYDILQKILASLFYDQFLRGDFMMIFNDSMFVSGHRDSNISQLSLLFPLSKILLLFACFLLNIWQEKYRADS